MEGVTVPTLSEALSQFITSKRRSKKVQEGYHQEVGRFVAWFGRDRKVGELSPSMVAEYAQVISQGGADSAQRVSPVKLFLTYLKEEGWVKVSLATHLRVPRNRRTGARRSDRASNGSPSQAGVTKLSQEGYDRLISDLESLKEERVRVVEDIKLAMADKDFRENAPLDAAKERQGFIESQIRGLEDSLAKAEVIDSSSSEPRQKVSVGAMIALRDVASGRKMVYTLVDVREADVASGKISTVSPIGQAILDRNVGDEVTVNVPRGQVQYLIQEILN